MNDAQSLTPAADLAANNATRFPNESDAYRKARNALLAEEIELRRRIERVAALRRALPPGGEVTKDYRFEGENGPAGFADLFAGTDTLVAYSFMYGPDRERPCPMCTSLMSAWAGAARNMDKRAALVLIARSPIERIAAFKHERGWKNLRIFSDPSGDYTRDYVSAEDADIPAINVFTREGGTIRHFWSVEMGFDTADPGQDPRSAPDPDPLWTILDMTPGGRGTGWYPTLD